MSEEKIPVGQVCQKSVKIKDWMDRHTFKCTKPATHIDKDGRMYCRHHAKIGRFVFRDGDIGEIVARFDTKDELLANRHLFPNFRMQHLSKSKRHDIAEPSLNPLTNEK